MLKIEKKQKSKQIGKTNNLIVEKIKNETNRRKSKIDNLKIKKRSI